MRPADENGTPTLADVVRRAVEICDPEGGDALLADLLARFDDRDVPVSAVEDVEGLMGEEAARLAPEGEDPALTMAAAVATYLAHRRDAVRDKREDLLRMAARAEFGGAPPEPVAGWLAAEGIAL